MLSRVSEGTCNGAPTAERKNIWQAAKPSTTAFFIKMPFALFASSRVILAQSYHEGAKSQRGETSSKPWHDSAIRAVTLRQDVLFHHKTHGGARVLRASPCTPCLVVNRGLEFFSSLA